ncbi:MAG: tetratricopeptide repeat protein [Cyanobacteria bacterium J06638_7]
MEDAPGKADKKPELLSYLKVIRKEFSAKETLKALDLCKEAIASHPKAIQLYELAGKCALRLGNRDEALDYVRHGLTLQPSKRPLLEMAFRLTRRAGDSRGSLSYALELIRIWPEESEYYIQAALEKTNLGDFNGAEQLISWGAKANPDCPRLRGFHSRYKLKNRLQRWVKEHAFSWDEKAFHMNVLKPSSHYLYMEYDRMVDDRVEEITSLRLLRFGRFSNFLIQLTNAIQFAQKTGIRHLYIAEDSSVRALFASKDSLLLELEGSTPLEIHIGGKDEEGIAVCSTFYYSRVRNQEFFLGLLQPWQVLRMMRPYTRFASTQYCESLAEESSLERRLCIHIRSGDLFKRGTVFISGYGQPPLSYYILAIEHFCPDSVSLVYEDELNPVIGCLREELRSRNIQVHCSSSSSLEDDILTIVSAKAVVIGRGSFAKGILGMNEVLEECYTFCERDSAPVHELSLFLPSSVKQFNVDDVTGEYIREVIRPWNNADYQRQLMISFHKKNLTLDRLR